jgi:GH15 family glucan-1,4-alpha-glucosidase
MTNPARTWSGQELASLEVGVVGNCHVAALVDRAARLDWMCYPRLDGDPLFCGLIAGDAPQREGDGPDGAFDISIAGGEPARQHYIENSPVLVTEVESPDGAMRVTDFCPRFVEYGRMFRPAMLIRMVEPIAGRPRIRISIRPRTAHGRRRAEWTRGSHHIRYILEGDVVRITTDAPIDLVVDPTPFLLARPLVFILGPDEPVGRPPSDVARELLERTIAHWREWARSLSIPFEWQDVVIRAAITLKLCAYEETGGIVAALTTSIPEYGQGARNWDYRFCWLRDSFFTVQALNRLGATKTLEDYMGYIGNIVAGSPDGRLQPLFGLRFETDIAEWEEPALLGYRNLGPVRFGNTAHTQAQHDAYGSVILAMAQAFFDERMLVRGSEPLFRQLEVLGRQAQALWSTPDAGLWEFRTRSAVHTHSAVMCWAACDRLARIGARLGLQVEAASWSASAATMRAGILERAWNGAQSSFVSTFEGEDIDASLLMLADVDFVSLDDPRFLSTVRRVEDALRIGNHVKRYATADDFGEPESAFTICTLWLIECLARVGRRDEARELFVEALGARNHLGLLSEGFHVGTGELWGNFPQTYSMVGLIRCASRLSRSWEQAF